MTLRKLLMHGEQLYQAADLAAQELHGGSGATECLQAAAGALEEGAALDPLLDALQQRLNNAYYEIDDIATELAVYRDRAVVDPYRQEEVESRLTRLQRLQKKYAAAAAAAGEAGDDAALSYLRAARAAYDQLAAEDASGAELTATTAAAAQDYRQAAADLSRLRRAAAERLGGAINGELQAMCMEQAGFRVECLPQEPSAHGDERIRFVARMNVGEAEQPISRIASGGELSRILLAIKVVLAQLDAVPVLVFDEVDTGMSGRALVAVAERLAAVGRSAQTLVISHAAVMAAAADVQIRIEKAEQGGRTEIRAAALAPEERVAELSRMIAGDKAGPATREQAGELLRQMHEGRLP